MKRSDAVKQLKYWLFGASNNPDHQNQAESLLNKIESMGMKPPKDPTLHGNDFEAIRDVFFWEKE